MATDAMIQGPDEALRRWLKEQRAPEELPLPFNTEWLVSLGSERLQGQDVPVAVFARTGHGFAKVYLLANDGRINTEGIQDAQASHTSALVINDPKQFRGLKYVIVYTGPDYKAFLRSQAGGFARS
jgi:hypothetical protein